MESGKKWSGDFIDFHLKPIVTLTQTARSHVLLQPGVTKQSSGYNQILAFHINLQNCQPPRAENLEIQ